MSTIYRILVRVLPAVLMMLVIFWFSAQPSSNLPDFSWLDRVVKKGGHMLGYAFLALAYWRIFEYEGGKRWLAWVLALAYAVTDELHQSFTPGRYPSAWDVLIFDNLGALIALWLVTYRRQKRPALANPVVEKLNEPGGNGHSNSISIS